MEQQEKKKMPKWLWFVIAGVLVAGLAAGAVFLFGGKKDNASEAQPQGN